MLYRSFGRTGLRVSEIALGAMRFGAPEGRGPSAAQSRAIFDRYADAGGNFIDTAHVYNGGDSERTLRDLIARDRGHFVVASKYGMAGEGADPIRAGGSRKAMRICVEESLRRLGTDYLDILYLHCWDFTVAADELMLAFDDLVRQGKILHAALSNVPAWIAARCVTMAECRGWPRPVAVQVPYSLASRGVERELLPMARDLNLGVAAWGPLGQGVLTSAPERRSGTGEVLHGVATAYGVSMARAALAWLRQRPDMSIIPVVGAATADEIGDCIASCNLTLDGDHLAALDAASAIELDYPYGLLGEPIYRDLLTGFRPDLLPDSGSSRATA